MDKSEIKIFSIEARKILMRSAETEAGFYGVTRKGSKNPIQKGNDFEVYETLAGTENRIYGADIKKRANLVEAVETLGFDQVIEETAYTWFNRIIAIRFMEVNGYLPTRVRVLSSETGSKTPDIISQSLDVDLNMTSVELEKVQKAKEENRYDDAFRMLFVKQCNELNAILPGLFEKTDDYMELLLKLSYTSDGVVRMLVDTVAEDNFNVETEGQIEIIGWMYQYYNTELKDDTFAKLKKNMKITKERIPAATQLFTPDWIVRYMVENSVGRVWIEHLRAIDSTINEKEKADGFGWKYYVPEAEQETQVQEKLVEVRKSCLSLEPKDITCIDPCMGSGHILVYMFDVLMDIYRSEGFSERDAAFSILENNIRGLDIDRRAYQLSYFALMMKARGYNRLFFRGIQNDDGERRYVEPLVFAIEESNDINREHLKFFSKTLDENVKNNVLDQINNLLDSLADAKEYGSILDIKNYDWELLKKFLASTMIDGQISFNTLGMDQTKEKLLRLIVQGEIMAEKYNAVVTNPPYMGISNGNGKLSDYVKKNYTDSKTDLYAIFIEKCEKMTKEHFFQAMITQHSWMFIIAYENLRNKIMNSQITSMVHLGARAFEEIAGEVVQTTSWIMRKTKIEEYRGVYCRLLEGSSQKDKERMFLSSENRFVSMQSRFSMITGKPIAYWASEVMIEAFNEGTKLSDICNTRKGLATSDNNRFLRLWHEVNIQKIDFTCLSNDFTKNNEKKWYPINKGGGFRRWYGNRDYVINWENDGYEIRNFKDSNGKLLSRPQNTQFNFMQALTWSKISSSDFSARYCESGFLFDDAAAICQHNNTRLIKTILGFLNSKCCQSAIRILNPTLNIQIGDIGNLPILKEESEQIEIIVSDCIAKCKEDWDSFEISWDFKRHPLVKLNGIKTVRDAFLEWKNECEIRFNELREKEESLNEKFIDIYKLKKELHANVEDNDITVSKADLQREIKSLISYSVGCMFGRYSLDDEGLVYAGGTWDSSKYRTYIPDQDGIILFSDKDYFGDDIVCRFEKFLEIAFGENNIEKNLGYIAEALTNKGDTSREIIRNYFLNDFFKDHCNTYSVTGSGKRPIYWLFDSGKENGFKCLIYIHRYTKDTLNLIRSEYLRKTEDAVENALKNIEYIIQTSASAVEKAKAAKDRDKYVKQLNEMRIYYQALSHLAIQKIEINLDDGVKNNYQLFQDIEVIADGGKKQKVDLLAKI